MLLPADFVRLYPNGLFRWCQLEFRAIRNLIKKRADEEVMFVRVDDVDPEDDPVLEDMGV